MPFTFAAVAQPVAERGWRPFPGLQTSKMPAMKGWSGLNNAEWDNADLAAAITEYQPADNVLLLSRRAAGNCCPRCRHR